MIGEEILEQEFKNLDSNSCSASNYMILGKSVSLGLSFHICKIRGVTVNVMSKV